jgi:mannose-1-phosphate guanylyltransferase
MAGGSGTRFWPQSRQDHPKQLIKLVGSNTLIQQTVLRLENLVPPERTLIVTAASQAQAIHRQLPQIPKQNIIQEPQGRNTAPCIALAAFYLNRLNPDSIMAVMPADHLIEKTDQFQQVLKKAVALAKTGDYLLTLGIKPRYPHTGYGYILLDEEIEPSEIPKVYHVKQFAEKPSAEKAREYLTLGALWNSGIFIWRTKVILNALKQYLPGTYNTMLGIASALTTSRQKTALARIYPMLEAISIDYAILEKYPQKLVVEGDFGWNDVGSWTSLREIFPLDENRNVSLGQHLQLESKNLIIHAPHKLVATIGLENIIIVETKDVLLVCHGDRAQEVRQLIEMLKDKGWEEYL